MSITFKTNAKLMDTLTRIIDRAGALGDVEILNRTDDRAFEISEFVKHGKSGCNYREEGDVNFRFIYDGFLEAVIVDEDFKTLDFNIAQKLDKEARAKADWLQEIREQQE